MKKKRSIKQYLLAGFPKKAAPEEKPVHVLLEATIEERKRLLSNWEKVFFAEGHSRENDIHAQLAKTISQYKKEKKLWDQRLFADPASHHSITKKQAA